MNASLLSDRRALARAFPLAFQPPRSGAAKVPLKINIVQDVIAAGVTGDDGDALSEDRIRRAVSHHCRGRRYHAACAAGGPRFDLNGQPAGEVTEGQRAWHRAKLRAFDRQDVMATEAA